MKQPSDLTLSVIVPAFDAEVYLSRCLEALLEERDENIEIVLVDDGSTDLTSQVAESRGIRVLRDYPNRGPGPARNLGVRQTCGEVLVFVDADVVVAPGVFQQIRDFFLAHPDCAAVVGSYDDQPAELNWVSQYRNLLHHFVHQHSMPDASHFWTGLGAMRKTAFLVAGGFDEGEYARTLEDVDLGYRLRERGYSIRLDRHLLGKHLKRWTLLSMIRTDFAVRGVPWTRLLLQRRRMPTDFSLGWAQRGSVVLACLAAAAFVSSLAAIELLPVAVGLSLLFLSINLPLFRFLQRLRGTGFAAACLPLHLLHHLVSAAAFAYGLGIHALSRPGVRARKLLACATEEDA